MYTAQTHTASCTVSDPDTRSAPAAWEQSTVGLKPPRPLIIQSFSSAPTPAAGRPTSRIFSTKSFRSSFAAAALSEPVPDLRAGTPGRLLLQKVPPQRGTRCTLGQRCDPLTFPRRCASEIQAGPHGAGLPIAAHLTHQTCKECKYTQEIRTTCREQHANKQKAKFPGRVPPIHFNLEGANKCVCVLSNSCTCQTKCSICCTRCQTSTMDQNMSTDARMNSA